jgi:hypothetical protein
MRWGGIVRSNMLIKVCRSEQVLHERLDFGHVHLVHLTA